MPRPEKSLGGKLKSGTGPTSKANWCFKSDATLLYHSLVTSLKAVIKPPIYYVDL